MRNFISINELRVGLDFNLFGYNFPRLASIFGGKFENGWFSDF